MVLPPELPWLALPWSSGAVHKNSDVRISFDYLEDFLCCIAFPNHRLGSDCCDALEARSHGDVSRCHELLKTIPLTSPMSRS
jgi:hypothetical protein